MEMRRPLRERLKIQERDGYQSETVEAFGSHGAPGEGWTLKRMCLLKEGRMGTMPPNL